VTHHGPMDVRCPDCGAHPGAHCTWTRGGMIVARRPHAARVQAACRQRRTRTGDRRPLVPLRPRARPAHEHNRDGTDCGLCPDCPRFRRAWLATLAGPPTPKDRAK
jgi:hypothetical protein